MVYYHAVDVVLQKTKEEGVRMGWKSECHLPKTMFQSKRKGRKRKSSQHCCDFELFRRMVTVKNIVYKHHRRMFVLYERWCHDHSEPKYWNDDDDDDGDTMSVQPAKSTNEVLEDDGF